MTGRPLLIISNLCSFLVGILLIISLSNWSKGVEVKFEIDLAELLNVATTIGLAVYIKLVLDKKSENNINVSHLISARIESVYSELNELKSELRSESKLPVNLANSIQKKLNFKGKDIERFLRKQEKRFATTVTNGFIQDFQQHTSEIKKLATDTPLQLQAGTASDISSIDNQYVYSNSRIELILIEINDLESLLLNMQYSLYSS